MACVGASAWAKRKTTTMSSRSNAARCDDYGGLSSSLTLVVALPSIRKKKLARFGSKEPMPRSAVSKPHNECLVPAASKHAPRPPKRLIGPESGSDWETDAAATGSASVVYPRFSLCAGEPKDQRRIATSCPHPAVCYTTQKRGIQGNIEFEMSKSPH